MDDLGDGYSLARTNKYNHTIVKGHKIIVDSNIIKYSLAGKYVLGVREKPDWFEVKEKLVSDKYGYFILDKESEKVDEGMDEKKFLAQALSLDINLDKAMPNNFQKTR